LDDIKTWTDRTGQANLRSFMDKDGNFWLEQNPKKALSRPSSRAKVMSWLGSLRRVAGIADACWSTAKVYAVGGDKEVLEIVRLAGFLV
jgi:hypothetical protein